MKVLILAEYYPRASDPVLGIWAHRQALAARDAGAEVRVLVLYRPIPSLGAVRHGDLPLIRASLGQRGTALLDGLTVGYVRYLSPPRPWSYGTWGAWAAPALRRAVRKLRPQFGFDLIHAHYAAPAGDAVRRSAPDVPLVISVHGGDLHGVAVRRAGRHVVDRALGHAGLVLANSAGTARRCEEHGARATRVVHLGTDIPDVVPATDRPPTLVTVGHLVARKRHADVIAALPGLRDRHPGLRYVVVGDGPQRDALRAQARSLGVGDIVELRGQLPHPEALAAARSGALFVMPSVDEAFGVAYVEAMAGGVPVIGCRGEDGPEEIAAAGGGITLVPRDNVEALGAQIDALLSNRAGLEAERLAARQTAQRAFSWPGCGRATVAAYDDVLRGAGSTKD